MNDHLFNIWVYLAASPLFGLSLTLTTYLIGIYIYKKVGFKPLFSPVIIAVFLIIIILSLSNISYQDYFEGGKFVHFFLGPATVALAVPLYQQLKIIRKLLLPILISIVVGVVVGAYSSIILAKFFGASNQVIISLIPKSVTSPVAMSISENIGGIPTLTVAVVVFTGIVGVITSGILFRILPIKNDQAKGFAMGSAAHGIGTAQSFLQSNQMGTFAGLAMVLMALLSSIFIPYLVKLINL